MLAILAVGLYAGALGNGFAVDDADLVQRNPWVRDLGRVGTFFTSDYWEPTLRSGLYRPLVMVSYALNHALTGDEPAGYRIVNLVLHALNTILVWTLARRLLASELAAAASGTLFGVHAVHTEAVVGITSGRPELLASALFLGALLLALDPVGAGRPTSERYGLSLLLYGLALLAKESAVTLVGVLVLCDLVRARPEGVSLGGALRRVLREHLASRYAGYVLVTVGYLALRWLALQDGPTLPPRIAIDNPLIELEPLARVVSALEVGWRAVGLLILPARLSYDYSYAQIPLITSPWSLHGLGVVTATGTALGLWLTSFRRAPRAFLAVGLFLVSFSVVSNVVIPIGTILGERLLYVPSVGFCLAVALALERLVALLPAPRWRVAAFCLALAALALPHAARAMARSHDWATTKRLYLHDLRTSPGSAKVHANAAGVLARWGRIEEAIEAYRKAIEIRPEGYAQPYQGLGYLLVELGAEEDGLALLGRAAAMAPDDPAILGSLALGYLRNGRYDEALDAVDRALRIDPASPASERRRALRGEIQKHLVDGAAGSERKPSPP